MAGHSNGGGQIGDGGMNGGIRRAPRKVAGVCAVAFAIAGSMTLITSAKATASPAGASTNPIVGFTNPTANGHGYRHGAVPQIIRAHPGAPAPLRTPMPSGSGVSNGALAPQAAAATTAYLTYGGGLTAGGLVNAGVTSGQPKVYLVIFGGEWGTESTNGSGQAVFSNDPDGEAPAFQGFYAGLGTDGEQWSGILTQYCDGVPVGSTSCNSPGAHNIPYPSGGVLAGVWYDNSTNATSETAAGATANQLAAEAEAAASHFGNLTQASNRDAQYVIASPTGTEPDGFNTPSGGFCAWHDDSQDSQLHEGGAVSGPIVAFTNMPYVPDLGTDCGAYYVNSGANGILDGATHDASHEYAETLTDEYIDLAPTGILTGWSEPSNNKLLEKLFEIADLCDYIRAPSPGAMYNLTLATGTFVVTGLWSNAAKGCVQNAPVAASPPTITSTDNTSFTKGTAGSFTVIAGGYPAPTITETGTLPTGVTLSSAGVLSGTPTQLGSFPITLTASNGISPNATQSFTLTVATSTNPAPSDELAWGYGAYGELGNGTTPTDQTTPVGVSLPAGITATATAGGSETGYAIGSNGVLYAWGNGTDGSLGNGTTTATQTSPVVVSLPTGVTATAIAAAQLSAYALGSNGTVYAWGYGFDGELGNGTNPGAQSTPVVVSLPTGVTATAIGATGNTGYAMGSNGTLYAWGDGTDGELGNGTTPSTQTTPVAVSLPTGVRATAIAGGEMTAYALGSNGTLYAWGYGSDGELGNNTTNSLSTPAIVQIPTGFTITSIAAGELSGYALGTNGTMYAWGKDTEGQLGNNSANDPQTKPIAVSLPSGVTASAIGSSEYTGFAIGSNGTLYTWGLGLDGNLGNGTTTFSQTTPVAVSLPAGVVPTSLGSESQSETGYAIVSPRVTLTEGIPTGTVIDAGQGFSSLLSATSEPAWGGALTWTTTASSPELTVSSSGVVTVPTSVTTPGTVTIGGTVSDAAGDTGTWSFTLTVDPLPPAINSANGATFTQGQAGTFTVTATGSPVPTFSETGSLPNGVIFTNGGVLSGTPTQTGSFPISITAANGISPAAAQSFTLTVNPSGTVAPTITSADYATFTLGQAGTVTVTATGSPVPTFSETGALPSGITLTSPGALSGATDQSGTFPIMLTATNGASPNATQSFTLTIAPAELAWGYGSDGELGNGTTTFTQSTPVSVSLPAGVTATAMAAGNATGYALGSNGAVYAWGYGSDGELGNGTTTGTTTPVVVSLPVGFTATAIAAEADLSTPSASTGYALGSNGTVYAWGYGSDGELGNGTDTATQTTPVAVSLPAGVTATAIAGGGDDGYAIGSDGNVYAWGYGEVGELGNGTTTGTTTPVAVSLPAGVTATAVAAGALATYAIGSNGTVYAWGYGSDGELGNGTTTFTQSTPVSVSLPAGVTATAIAGGGLNGYAIGLDGTVYAWGYGSDGELGNGTTTGTTTPVAVSLPGRGHRHRDRRRRKHRLCPWLERHLLCVGVGHVRQPRQRHGALPAGGAGRRLPPGRGGGDGDRLRVGFVDGLRVGAPGRFIADDLLGEQRHLRTRYGRHLHDDC